MQTETMLDWYFRREYFQRVWSRKGISARRGRPRESRCLIGILLAIVAVAAGCGSGHSAIVARVGDRTIQKSTLDHWTISTIENDYFIIIRKRAPVGLASPPSNVSACVAAARRLAFRAGLANVQFREGHAGSQCRDLYRAASLQALEYLISLIWGEGQVAELGARVSSRDVAHQLVAVEQKATQGNVDQPVPKNGLRLADLYQTAKASVDSAAIAVAIKKRLGNNRSQEDVARSEFEVNRKWLKKTHCERSYVVSECIQFRSPPSHMSSPAVLIEEMTKPHVG
jgi:hypothetical protein